MAAAAACVLGASPALAENIALTIWNTADVPGAVSATGTGSVVIGFTNLAGVTIDGSFGTKPSPANKINGAQFLITNTTGGSETVELAVGAIGFVGKDNKYRQSATVILQSGDADLTGGYFVDALNRQGGLTALAPSFGVENAMFDSGSLAGPFSFSFNNTVFTPNSGLLFSMGEILTLTLSPDATVGVQGISMTASAVPEPATWVMLGGGFVLVASLAIWSRKRTPRYAV